jgi:hypothetical protein
VPFLYESGFSTLPLEIISSLDPPGSREHISQGSGAGSEHSDSLRGTGDAAGRSHSSSVLAASPSASLVGGAAAESSSIASAPSSMAGPFTASDSALPSQSSWPSPNGELGLSSLETGRGIMNPTSLPPQSLQQSRLLHDAGGARGRTEDIGGQVGRGGGGVGGGADIYVSASQIASHTRMRSRTHGAGADAGALGVQWLNYTMNMMSRTR